MNERQQVAVESLSYCGGCAVAMHDMGSVLLDMRDERFELTHAPLIMSAKKPGEVDLLLLTGAVRNEEDVAVAQDMRKCTACLVAFGSCAAFGGVPGLANLRTTDELMNAAYSRSPA